MFKFLNYRYEYKMRHNEKNKINYNEGSDEKEDKLCLYLGILIPKGY